VTRRGREKDRSGRVLLDKDSLRDLRRKMRRLGNGFSYPIVPRQNLLFPPFVKGKMKMMNPGRLNGMDGAGICVELIMGTTTTTTTAR